MKDDTSWEDSGQWYHSLVGEGGHYYHQMILPNVIRLLGLEPGSSLLDLACGQAVLARALPKGVQYHGVDISPSLLKEAKKLAKGIALTEADICKPLPLQGSLFSHATLILAVQNLEKPELAFKEAARHLDKKGRFVIVMNHPCFRIPRQSHWGVDEAKKLQFRRMDSYFSSQKIPIHTHPGKGGGSPTTLSFHHPLSSFTQWLFAAGFVICTMEEWCSDKKSTGKNAKMENRARGEFPLFLAIAAEKRD